MAQFQGREITFDDSWLLKRTQEFLRYLNVCLDDYDDDHFFCMTDDDMLDIVRQYAQDTHWALPDGMYWDIVQWTYIAVLAILCGFFSFESSHFSSNPAT